MNRKIRENIPLSSPRFDEFFVMTFRLVIQQRKTRNGLVYRHRPVPLGIIEGPRMGIDDEPDTTQSTLGSNKKRTYRLVHVNTISGLLRQSIESVTAN
jgi:hypothetical protein